VNYSILDCTLRDGGYYTNWDFSNSLVDLYLGVLAEMDVEIIELGYLSPALSGYLGRFYYLPTHTLAHARGILRPDQKLAVMLNAKDCDPNTIGAVVKPAQGLVQIVRLAVAPEQIEQGIAVARAVAQEGFEIAFNVMYLSKYAKDVSVLAPLAQASDVIKTVSLVDSFGGCFPDQVGGAMRLAKNALPQKIGFHGHDNIMLAFANSLAALEAGADLVDATILGMGRGAGNLRTELILAYKARKNQQNVSFAKLGSLLEQFEIMRSRFSWGSNLPYIVSGLADLPQKDVMDWLGKDRYSTAAIVGALQKQGEGLVDRVEYSEIRSAAQIAPGRVMVIGGGASVRDHAEAIAELANRSCSAVVHSSLRNLAELSSVTTPQYVCLPGHNAILSSSPLGNPAVAGYVVPPPPRFVGTALGSFQNTPVLQAAPIEAGTVKKSLGPVSDVGPLALALGAARDLKAQEIVLVGFDGY
jgi:4-hydroxy 2-oxovalerate aldolase